MPIAGPSTSSEAHGRRLGGVAFVAFAVVVLTGCPTPGGPTSPDPVRVVLQGGPGPCRVVFGPVTPDAAVQLQEVGEIATADGPTFIRRGLAVEDGNTPDLEIAGIDVDVSSTADAVEATWQLPPDEVGVVTRSLDEDDLRELLPALVTTADSSQLAAALVDRIPGAELRYAGRAPGYDVGLSYEDGSLSVAGRGVADAQLDAFYAVLGGQQVGGGGEWRTNVEGSVESRASGPTVIVASGRGPVEVSSPEFAEVVDELTGVDAPTVAVSDGRRVAAGAGCDGPRQQLVATDATISDVSIVESDVGDLLRITFDGLPADQPDPQLLHVTVGDVELVAEYVGDETVLFPATLTHDESRLLAERLTT